MSEQLLQLDFRLPIPLMKAEETSVRGERVRHVSGLASLEVKDTQGETVIQKGIDFDPLLTTGYINWDHLDIRKGGSEWYIGEPTDARIVEHHGVPALRVEGFIYNDPANKPQSEAAWGHLMVTAKSGSGRRMGWSIQGAAMARRDGIILKSVVNDLALTAKPIVRQTTVDFHEIAKSLGPDGRLPATMLAKAVADTTSLATLLREDLHGAAGPAARASRRRGLSVAAYVGAIYGGERCGKGCFDDAGRFARGAAGAFDHLVGCLGTERDEAEALVKLIRDSFRSGNR